MKRAFVYLIAAILMVITSCSPKDTSNILLVKGGEFKNKKSNLYDKKIIMPDFYIGKYEVTQKEWEDVMGYNPSKFKGDSLPVEMVSWYDCVEYCNARSLKEGLEPYYNIYKDVTDTLNISEFDSLKWTVTLNIEANGYRLPTEVEWEYAAGGGQKSKSYTYSGSNDIDKVAWYWRNTGDKFLTGAWFWSKIENNNSSTKAVGLKKPNELGIYDMTGNVREWCDEWFVDYDIQIGIYRAQRGGGWIGSETPCETADRNFFDANGFGPDQGFRICRNI